VAGNNINDQLAADHRNRSLIAAREGPATVTAAGVHLEPGPVVPRWDGPSTTHDEPRGPLLGL
jgi:hypothetical protein